MLLFVSLVGGCVSPARTPSVHAPGPTLEGSRQPTPAPPAQTDAAAETAVETARFDYANNVYFEFGKTAVNGRGKETLTEHAKRLKQNRKMILTLIGRTDNLGSRTYNQAIAEERLDSVVKVLNMHGVTSRQLRRIALGIEKSNFSQCRSDTCRATMRRVELVYEKPGRP